MEKREGALFFALVRRAWNGHLKKYILQMNKRMKIDPNLVTKKLPNCILFEGIQGARTYTGTSSVFMFRNSVSAAVITMVVLPSLMPRTVPSASTVAIDSSIETNESSPGADTDSFFCAPSRRPTEREGTLEIC